MLRRAGLLEVPQITVQDLDAVRKPAALRPNHASHAFSLFQRPGRRLRIPAHRLEERTSPDTKTGSASMRRCEWSATITP